MGESCLGSLSQSSRFREVSLKFLLLGPPLSLSLTSMSGIRQVTLKEDLSYFLYKLLLWYYYLTRCKLSFSKNISSRWQARVNPLWRRFMHFIRVKYCKCKRAEAKRWLREVPPSLTLPACANFLLLFRRATNNKDKQARLRLHPVHLSGF